MLALSLKRRRDFRRDIVTILTLRPRRRAVGSVLMKGLRAAGWRNTWANYDQFALLCARVQLYRYRALGQSHRLVEFIALDERPAIEPDHFAEIGFVIAGGLGWVNRGNPAKTTPLHSMARIWKTRRGVVGYCRNNNHALDAIHKTREVQPNAIASVAY